MQRPRFAKNAIRSTRRYGCHLRFPRVVASQQAARQNFAIRTKLSARYGPQPPTPPTTLRVDFMTLTRVAQ